MRKRFITIAVLASAVLLSTSCTTIPAPPDLDFRQEMRDFVIGLSDYAKNIDNSFIIIPQNGQEIVTDNGEGDGNPNTAYLAAIDATGRESMFYGYYNDDEATPVEDKQHLLNLCLACEANGVEVLTTDYCSTESRMLDSYNVNNEHNFISFAADQRNLNNIPDYPSTPYEVNNADITDISLANNFLYLINSEIFSTKDDFITAVSATNYDVIIMDLYHNEEAYTAAEIELLKTKPIGGTRLIICYMSIAEAEDYRCYWDSSWETGDPIWLDRENPDWGGNYKVRYWEKDWQSIIFGNNNSYLKMIINAGFNGVYLDIIDAFEYFEEDY